ncbi:Dual specificity phosphatase 28 [Merluccius polli]|uniref:Dual specificity phosphatase 28 n=1 Tax=Merluccius polli TaxID=89951 RepID=A0AA47P7W9_MERPO|nr:Dual specificity phosphatase 28 [Merluccius polli]
MLRIPVYDDPNEDLYRHFDRCADAIQSEADRGGRTVVYCKNGRSRSATVCVAYLMKHRKLSLADAIQKVKTARHVIDPNPGFIAQLERYEQELKKRRGQTPSLSGRPQPSPQDTRPSRNQVSRYRVTMGPPLSPSHASASLPSAPAHSMFSVTLTSMCCTHMARSTSGTLMTFSAELKCASSPCLSLPQPVTTVTVPLRWSTRSAKARGGRQAGAMEAGFSSSSQLLARLDRRTAKDQSKRFYYVIAELLIQRSYYVIAELLIQRSYYVIAELLIQRSYYVIAELLIQRSYFVI